MDFIRSANTSVKQCDVAVKNIATTLHRNPSLILFFASTAYPFEQLVEQFQTLYPNAQVVGVTTTGEIGPEGFNEHSLSVQSYADRFGQSQAVLMKNIEKYPIFERPKLLEAAQQIGINIGSAHPDKEGVAFVFPVGLKSGEENMLSIVNSIFAHDGFSIFGGTAGDDAKFIVTKVSVNGQITSSGGAVIFVKPNMDFYIQKENIFKSTGHKVKITKADAQKRIVYEMDGRPAAQVYAEKLNVSVAQLPKHLPMHPLGRKFNEDFLIASPFEAKSSGEIAFYCQVYEGAIVEILEPKDAIQEMTKTVAQFKGRFEELYGVVGCNCILRKLQFSHQRIFNPLNQQLKMLPNLTGFSSYGEQFNKTQLNQTLLLIGFGKLRME